MSRIKTAFANLAAQRKKALIPFITAGYPCPESTVPLMRALAQAGADIIELGVPFSDPMADGPTIQRASEVALAGGMTLNKVLDAVAAFRQKDGETPVVLMGYANPIEAMGADIFADKAARAGVDGVLTVDYPPEEAGEFAALLGAYQLDPIFLLAPTSPPDRWQTLRNLAAGYVYYVSVKGVTGSGQLNLAEIAGHVRAIQNALGLPVGVGFGIRDRETAASIAALADAVVVGSRLIEELEQSPAGEETARLAAFVHELRQGLDEARS
jgi:tryptophan synthase alpha chain